MLLHPEIVQRDDGAWSIGWRDDAPGPFQSREHAAAVVARQYMSSNGKREVKNAGTP